MTLQTAAGWFGENMELVVAVASSAGAAIVSVVAAVFSARETAKQRRLQVERLRAEIDAQSLAWGREAIQALSEAGDLAFARDSHLTDTAFKARRAELASTLSALADRGRLFFPNIDPESKGAEKDGAYKGARPAILDAVIYAYYEIEALKDDRAGDAQASCAFIMDCRRLVVSELQAHLDPRRRNEIVERHDHVADQARVDALESAGRLALRLDARRPGTLARRKDEGWTALIAPDERRRILHEARNGGAA